MSNTSTRADRLQQDGFVLLRDAVARSTVAQLIQQCDLALQAEAGAEQAVRARSAAGHIYAARNLIDAVPIVLQFWKRGELQRFLRQQLGDAFGLVRVLYFDKPPDRSWSLPWHQDRAIAVRDHQQGSEPFSRPSVKAGVPHVIASDELLQRMLTLRLHLDDVDQENGALEVIPGSHQWTGCMAEGIESKVRIDARAGDVLAMRPLIQHSSAASDPQTRRHRRIVHLEFAADPQLPSGYQWHRFESR